jgi:transcriptional regulator with XRE-family HTH domain
MNQPEFGKELIRVRKSKGLTQSELADKCDVSYRTIQRIESGIVTPRSFTIRTLSKALEHDFFTKFPNEPMVNESIETGEFIFGKWIISQTMDLFNLKKNAMKKLSILTVITVSVVIGFFTFSNESIAQDNPPIINFLTIDAKSDISKKEAIKIIGDINKKASYHNKSLDLIKTYAEKADDNFDSYVHFAKLVGSFGYATQTVMEIANIAFMAKKECELYNDIASLIFLNAGNNSITVIGLAKSASEAKTDEEINNIQKEIEKYKAQSKFATLNDAFKDQK